MIYVLSLAQHIEHNYSQLHTSQAIQVPKSIPSALW